VNSSDKNDRLANKIRHAANSKNNNNIFPAAFASQINKYNKYKVFVLISVCVVLKNVAAVFFQCVITSQHHRLFEK